MKKSSSILIIEDDDISAIHLQELLEDAGYTVLGIVEKGADAIVEARDKKPDLVVVDILIKDGNSGCDAAVQINQNNPAIAIIFLSEYAEETMIERAKESNAYAYLMNPYHDQEILATIRVVLSRQQKQNLLSSSDIIKLKNDFSFDLKTLTLKKMEK